MTEIRDIPSNLARLRRDRGLSQESVAEKLGVDKSTVHRWEQGTRLLNLQNLDRLASIYGVDVAALIMAPEDADLVVRLTAAKVILEQAPPDAADRWLATGRDIVVAQKGRVA